MDNHREGIFAQPDLSRHSRRKAHSAALSRRMGMHMELVDRACLMARCAQRLGLAAEAGPEGWDRVLLEAGWFCRDRLCPFCAWRDAVAWRRRVTAGLDAMAEAHPTHQVVMLTLTQRNVPLGELGAELDRIAKAWRLLVQRPEFPGIGWLRRTEITLGAPPNPADLPPGPHSCTDGHADPNPGDFTVWVESKRKGKGILHLPRFAHPHIHALLVVRSSYFGRDYVTQKRWQELWADCLRVDYPPVVDIRRAHAKNDNATPEQARAAAVRECAKYVTKSSQVQDLGPDLCDFAAQVKGRRMIATNRWLSRFIKTGEISAEEMTDLQESRLATGRWLHFVAEWSAAEARYIPQT